MAKQQELKRSFASYCLKEGKKELLTLYDLNANELSPWEIPYSTSKKVVFHCRECGETWWISPNKANRIAKGEWNVILKKKQVTYCKFCLGRKPSAKYSLATEYPNFIPYYDNERNKKQPHEYSPKSHDTVYIKCRHLECNYKRAKPVKINDLVRRLDRYRCPKCEGGKNVEVTDWNSLRAVDGDVANSLIMTEDGRSADEVLPSSNKGGIFRCIECGHIYRARISNHTYLNQGCPRKIEQRRTAFVDQAIYYYLTQCGTEVRRRWIDEITGLEIDIFLPEKLVAIECGSKYYHKDKNDAEKLNKLSMYYRLYVIQNFECGTQTPLLSYIQVPTFMFTKAHYRLFDGIILELLKKLFSGLPAYPSVNLSEHAIAILDQYICHAVDNSFGENHPLLASDWYQPKNGNLLPTMFHEGFKVPFFWKCRNKSCGRIYQSLMSNRLKTDPDTCPFCARANIEKNGGITLVECMPEIRRFWHPILNTIKLEQLLPYAEDECVFLLAYERIVFAKIANLFSWWRSNPGRGIETYLEFLFLKQHGRK